VFTVRTELAADDSFAEILARSRFGMAMAAMIRIIATTISSSIREKPLCSLITLSSPFLDGSVRMFTLLERHTSRKLQIFYRIFFPFRATRRIQVLADANQNPDSSLRSE
jgi:hypothetical protein